MTTHTPAPWKIDDTSAWLEIHAGDTVVAVDVNGRANAHLIAAAPELLELLQQAAAIMRTTGRRASPWMERACAAIAKAEGRTA